ncbi:hypothetical protein ACFY0A_42175 [Streptomyces sp. NPDC001698]|uniref:hypothetical protein n=1 Tax=unclassified Streptomyces TaxID=2593676 RepID=UPI00369A26EF
MAAALLAATVLATPLTATTAHATPQTTTTASPAEQLAGPPPGPGWTYKQRFFFSPHGGVDCAMFGMNWTIRKRWDDFYCEPAFPYFNLWVLNKKW